MVLKLNKETLFCDYGDAAEGRVEVAGLAFSPMAKASKDEVRAPTDAPEHVLKAVYMAVPDSRVDEITPPRVLCNVRGIRLSTLFLAGSVALAKRAIGDKLTQAGLSGMKSSTNSGVSIGPTPHSVKTASLRDLCLPRRCT